MSVQHVADALEFSKANFYNHVKSKEELLYRIFVDNLEYTVRSIEDIVDSENDPAEKLRWVISFYARMMIERAEVMTIWFRERRHLTPEHQLEVTWLERRILDALESLYAEGVAAAVFRPFDLRVIQAVVSGTTFNLTRWTAEMADLPIDTVVEQVVEFATSGLLRRQPTLR